MRKVRAHGIDGKILGGIKAWLADRSQRVIINGCKSEWGQVGRVHVCSFLLARHGGLAG